MRVGEGCRREVLSIGSQGVRHNLDQVPSGTEGTRRKCQSHREEEKGVPIFHRGVMNEYDGWKYLGQVEPGNSRVVVLVKTLVRRDLGNQCLSQGPY